jgi:hypothetical protein
MLSTICPPEFSPVGIFNIKQAACRLSLFKVSRSLVVSPVLVLVIDWKNSILPFYSGKSIIDIYRALTAMIKIAK